MADIKNIDSSIVAAMKAKDQMTLDTLRGLKVRLANERIAKTRDLEDSEVLALIRSEIKRRKEAAEAFVAGGRQDSADKELAEAAIIEMYLPPQMSEDDVRAAAKEVVAAGSFVAADFGKAMGMLKAKLGDGADGATMAKVLKEVLS